MTSSSAGLGLTMVMWIPSRVQAAECSRAWLLWPMLTSTKASQPFALTSAMRNSRARTLLPPNAKPVRSSRLTRMRGPPSAAESFGASRGVGTKAKGMRGSRATRARMVSGETVAVSMAIGLLPSSRARRRSDGRSLDQRAGRREVGPERNTGTLTQQEGSRPTMTETASANPAQASGVTWDLSDLFAGADDPRLWQALDEVKADGEAFAAHYRGLIAVPGGPDAATLLAGVQAYEALYERAGRVETYAHLLYDSDTRDVAARDLSQKVEQRLTELRNLTLFFDLEWLELPDDVAERLIADPALAPYAHYLRHERAFRPHRLTEAEEKMVNEKDVTGRSAWGRLHTELTSGLTFSLERDGQTQSSTSPRCSPWSTSRTGPCAGWRTTPSTPASPRRGRCSRSPTTR